MTESQEEVTLSKWIMLRRVVISVGFLILLSGIFAYQLGLSGSRGLSKGKVALLGLGVVILLVGILWRKTPEVYRTIAILLLNTLALLAAIEISLTLFARLRDFLPQRTTADTTVSRNDTRYVDEGREKLPYYAEQEWGKTYWREYHEVWDERQLPFEPYILWRSAPYGGETINIDEQGRRVTPGAECGTDAYTVYTFGGSTMWGTGVPDWGTIAAFLQQGLAESRDEPVCVINFGEQAWVSTQSVVQLMLELRAGNVPDLVIFYDGNNDIFAAYQSGEAGVPQNLPSIEARFEEREEIPPMVALLSRFKTYNMLQRLTQGEDDRQPVAPFEAEGTERGDLADEIAETYLANYDLIGQLAEAYGFDFYFFWQTTLLVDEKPLTPEEAGIRSIALGIYPGVQGLYKDTTTIVAAAARDRTALYSVMDVFEDEEDLTFIDPFHVTVDGNQLIAERMLEIVDISGAD